MSSVAEVKSGKDIFSRFLIRSVDRLIVFYRLVSSGMPSKFPLQSAPHGDGALCYYRSPFPIRALFTHLDSRLVIIIIIFVDTAAFDA